MWIRTTGRVEALLLLATVMLAAPAWASQLVEVRVGNHPTYTRVVFELDAPAGYKIERRIVDGVSEILVTLDAGSTPISVTRKTYMVERVAVQDGRDRSVAHIRLKQHPSRVKEMILANPPRLVFDLVFPESKLAEIRQQETVKKAEQTKAAEAAQQAKSTVAATATTGQAAAARKAEQAEAAKKAQEAEARETARKAEAAKAAEAKRKAEAAKAAEAKRKTEAAKAAEAKRKAEAAQAAEAKRKAEAREIARKVEEAQAAEAKRTAEAAKMADAARRAEKVEAQEIAQKVEQARAREAARLAAEAKTAGDSAPDAKPGELAEAPPIVAVTPDEATLTKDVPTLKPPKAARPGSAGSRADSKSESPASGVNWALVSGSAAAALMLVILVVVWLRRRAIPNDIDVTALAEDAGAADGATASAEDFSWGEESVEGESAQPASPATDDLPAPASAPGPAITAGPGSDEEHKEENEMDSETSGLPMERAASETATVVGGAAASGDVGRLLSELDRRVAQLETRLDESVDARERLERQVAAQAEELRVQRAAIARTQRALRSLNRGDEEQATEPAIREPSS